MEIDDLLLTLAEISVTFAGLIGIMVAFTARDGKLSGADSLRVRAIIVVSIYAAFFALLPIVLLSIPDSKNYAWTASLAAHLVFIVLFSLYQRWYEVKAGKDVLADVSGVHRYVAWLLASLVVILHLVNLSPWFGAAQPGIYALAILVFMVTGGIIFIGLIFRRLL